MNRRLVNGLLLLTLATGSCSMFTSCKDTDEDWKNQMVLGQVSVEDKLKDLEEAIKDLESMCPNCCQGIIDALRADLEAQITALGKKLEDKADKSEVTDALNKISEAVERITFLEGQYKTLQTNLTDLKTLVDGLKSRLDGVDTKLTGLQDQINDAIEAINQAIDLKVSELKNQIATINTSLSTLEADLNTLQGTVGGLQTDVTTLKTNVSTLQASLTTVQTSLSNLTNRVGTLETNLANLTTTVTNNATAISTLQTNYTDLSTKLTNLETSLGGRIQVLEDYKTNTIEPAITKLNTLYDQINGEDGLLARLVKAEGDIAAQALLIAQNAQDIATNKSDIATNAAAIAANKAAIEAFQSSLDSMQQTLAAHTKQISALQEAVNLYFSALRDQLNSLITGIILNQTWNPLFGAINLPIGIETTIAANYYGQSDHALDFPLGSGAYEYNGNESALNSLIEDAAAWNNLLNNLKSPETIGYYMFDANSINAKNQYAFVGNERYMTDVNNNLGQLYLTINPNNVDFSNVNLSLVNSMDEAAPIALDVKKCNDEVLTFGLSRSAENNGFYRANLKVRPADATKIGVRIEDGLKSSMKEALKDRTKGDLARFGKKLLDQLSGILPAYAIKAEWKAPVVETDENGKEVTVNKTFATYSDYNIAATALRPLGYSFLYGVDFTDHTIGGHHIQLPTYSGGIEEILDKIFDGLNFDLKLDLGTIDNITYDDFKVEFDLSKVDFSFDEPMEIEIKIDLNGTVLTTTQEIEGETEPKEVEITIGGKPGTPEWSESNVITTTLTYNPDGSVELGTMGELAPFVDSIKDAINNFINGDGDKSLAYQINEQINNQLVHKLVDQVNNIIDQINDMISGDENGIVGNIDSAFANVIDQIKNSLAGKLGKIDSLIDKYNSLAKRINKILKNPNHYLQVMMAYEDGSGNLHHLSTNRNIPSSFRFAGGDAIELFMTSYTAELVAPSFAKYVAVSRVFNMKGEKLSDSETTAKSINDANDYLNVLLPGTLQRVPLKAQDLKPGNIYEVVLSSVDYRGFTSSRLYYFMVSK